MFQYSFNVENLFPSSFPITTYNDDIYVDCIAGIQISQPCVENDDTEVYQHILSVVNKPVEITLLTSDDSPRDLLSSLVPPNCRFEWALWSLHTNTQNSIDMNKINVFAECSNQLIFHAHSSEQMFPVDIDDKKVYYLQSALNSGSGCDSVQTLCVHGTPVLLRDPQSGGVVINPVFWNVFGSFEPKILKKEDYNIIQFMSYLLLHVQKHNETDLNTHNDEDLCYLSQYQRESTNIFLSVYTHDQIKASGVSYILCVDQLIIQVQTSQQPSSDQILYQAECVVNVPPQSAEHALLLSCCMLASQLPSSLDIFSNGLGVNVTLNTSVRKTADVTEIHVQKVTFSDGLTGIEQTMEVNEEINIFTNNDENSFFLTMSVLGTLSDGRFFDITQVGIQIRQGSVAIVRTLVSDMWRAHRPIQKSWWFTVFAIDPDDNGYANYVQSARVACVNLSQDMVPDKLLRVRSEKIMKVNYTVRTRSDDEKSDILIVDTSAWESGSFFDHLVNNILIKHIMRMQTFTENLPISNSEVLWKPYTVSDGTSTESITRGSMLVHELIAKSIWSHYQDKTLLLHAIQSVIGTKGLLSLQKPSLQLDINVTQVINLPEITFRLKPDNDDENYADVVLTELPVRVQLLALLQ